MKNTSTGKTPGTPAGKPALLSAEHIALIDSGVSAIVASRDAAHRPSLMRAVGASITPDGSQISVYLNRPASTQLLADLQATGQIAVVFSEPSTHRAVQVKASRVQLRDAAAADAPQLQRYLRAMEGQLERSGPANLNSAISGNSGHEAGPKTVWQTGVFNGQEISATHPSHPHASLQGPSGPGGLA